MTNIDVFKLAAKRGYAVDFHAPRVCKGKDIDIADTTRYTTAEEKLEAVCALILQAFELEMVNSGRG